MPAFQIKEKEAKILKQKDFKDEEELHKLIDNNLNVIFGIRYIKDEHVTDKHGRIETLGLDENNRPVVIEYKKVKEKGQLTQANRYMTWILQNPDSFELLARKNLEKIKNIDFANPRIICFAQEFSIDDKCLALSLGAELWKYRYYENGTLTIIREEEPDQLIKRGKKTSIIKMKRKPKKTKTVEEHLHGASKELIKLYWELDEKIGGISSEIGQYTNQYEILYKTSLNFAYYEVQKKKNRLRILLRTLNNKMDDPKSLTTKIPKHFGWGNITRKVFVSPMDIESKQYTIDDIMELILQSYNTTQ